MAKKEAAKKVKTQEYLPFTAVYNDVLILKGGEYRMILLVNSLNFSLKSEEEQTAIVYAFQGFLNSLSFPVQILVRSRQMDLSEYLKGLRERLTQETNELIRYQTQEYIDFVTKLISIANIMEKKFFVVVAHKSPKVRPGGLLGPKAPHLQVPLSEFQTIREELLQKVQIIQQGLANVGLKSTPLTTSQIIELLYSSYNITEGLREKLPPETLTALEEEAVTTPQAANQPVTSPPQQPTKT